MKWQQFVRKGECVISESNYEKIARTDFRGGEFRISGGDFQILVRLIERLGGYGCPKSGVSHWLWSSPLAPYNSFTAYSHCDIIFFRNSPTGQTPRRISARDGATTRPHARVCLLGLKNSKLIFDPLKIPPKKIEIWAQNWTENFRQKRQCIEFSHINIFNRHRSPIKVVQWIYIGNMATRIPNMWSFLTPCLQVTWHGACTVNFLAFNVG